MNPEFEVIIFYKYARVADPFLFMRWTKKLCESIGIKGRILIAQEGINGSVEGTRAQLDLFESALRETTYGDFNDLWFKSSPGTGNAFRKLKVKARETILNIGLGEEDVDPNKITGTHIEAEELHRWFEQGEEFEIIDMRNEYEYAVGRFKGSVDPKMTNFRDLPNVLPRLEYLKKKKILTVCTYGVRCEKASGYLLKEGFENVYQLHGGIGTYMKQYPAQHFEGSLYVFDERMTEQFTQDYEVVGICVRCENKSERYGNCALIDCHKQLIICESCQTQQVWCSKECSSKKQDLYVE
jgi:UPF0176 protein